MYICKTNLIDMEELKEIRIALGVKQNKVVAFLGINPSAFSLMENGLYTHNYEREELQDKVRRFLINEAFKKIEATEKLTKDTIEKSKKDIEKFRELILKLEKH